MLKTESLTKYFGKTAAVKNVCLDLPEPGTVGLLGPNASGKSTILKMMCGSLAPTSGRISICGFDIATDPIEAKRRLGYLQDTPLLYKEFKVKDYLKLVATLKRIGGNSLKSELDRVIAACNLEPVMAKTIGAVSKGFRQRVGIAQAILGRPKVLLLDEPTASLDPIQAREINDLLKELAKESLVFLSTHILSEAAAACQKIYIVSAGEIRETIVPVGENKWKIGDKVETLDRIIVDLFA